MNEIVAIYILPTEEPYPPRALLLDASDFVESTSEEMRGILTTWNADLGVWVVNGTPVSSELGEVISGRCKALGVGGW